MLNLIVLLLPVLTLGCGSSLDNFVRTAKPPTLGGEIPIAPPRNLELEGQLGNRVSPGSVISKSPHLGMKAGANLVQTPATGPTLGARIGVARSPARF